MKNIVKNKLFEDPDTSHAKRKELKWENPTAHPFGVSKTGEVAVGPPGNTHGSVGEYSGIAYGNYQGRIWPLDGVIAFWEAPNKQQLMIILQNLILDDEISVYELDMEDFNDFIIDIPSSPELSPFGNFTTTIDEYYTLSDYPNSPHDENKKVEQRPEHSVSPVLKTKKKVPPGFGSKHPKAGNLKWKQALVSENLNESPDVVRITDFFSNEYKSYSYSSHNAFPFGFRDDKAFIGNAGSTHGSLLGYLDEKGIAERNANPTLGPRDLFKYSGRFWVDGKVISFWEYPRIKKELTHLLNLLQDAAWSDGIQFLPFDEDWLIEVIETKLDSDGDEYSERITIPLKDFKGSSDASKEELEQEHVQSPMLKKKKGVPSGVGSKRYGSKKPLQYRQKMYAESYYPRLNENPNAIIDPEVWEKKKNQKSYTPDKIEYDSLQNIPFGYYGAHDAFITGGSRDTHSHLLSKAKKLDLIQTAGESIERPKNSGRIFVDHKVITFWTFPETYEELIKVIKDIENNTNLNILNDPEWKIEIPSGEFKSHLDKKDISWGSWHPRIGQVEYISIKDFRGGYKRSEEELGQEHIQSPIKKKKKEVPSGVGSKRYGSKKPLKYRQKLVAESLKEGIHLIL